MCHWYQFKTTGWFFICFLFSGGICSQRGFIYLLLFLKAFYLAKSNINCFLSKTLCQHKHALTSFPKESPVGSKPELKFLSEACWRFATWLLVGVPRLQNTILKGRRPWGSVHLAVQVAAHQTKEHHQRFTLNPITPYKSTMKLQK